MKHIIVKTSLFLTLLLMVTVISPIKANAANNKEHPSMANDKEAQEIYEFFSSILYKCVYSEVEADQLNLYDLDIFCNQIGVSKEELITKYERITKKCANVVERYNLNEGDCASCDLSEDEKIEIFRLTLTVLKTDYVESGVINLPKIPEPAPEQVKVPDVDCDWAALAACMALCGAAAASGPAAPTVYTLCCAYCIYQHCSCDTSTTGTVR